MTFFENRKNPKKLKLLLVSFILIIFGIIVTVFIGYRRILNEQDRLISAIHLSKANISIGKVNHTATRNGKKEWTLIAKSARIMGKKQHTIVEEPSVVFFLDDGSKVYLTAKRGILESGSNNMRAIGHVVVKNKQYTLRTEHLYYLHKKRIIFSKSPVKISGDRFYLMANSLIYNLNTKKSLFKGRVKGTIDEEISL